MVDGYHHRHTGVAWSEGLRRRPLRSEWREMAGLRRTWLAFIFMTHSLMQLLASQGFALGKAGRGFGVDVDSDLRRATVGQVALESAIGTCRLAVLAALALAAVLFAAPCCG